MQETLNLDKRLTAAEYRLQTHSEQILHLTKKTDDQGATLSKISKTLDRLLWLAIGSCLFWSATELGILQTLRAALL